MLGSDKLGRGAIEWADRSQVTGRYVGAAVEFVKAREAEGKPFYVNVWPDDVHSPFFSAGGEARQWDETRALPRRAGNDGCAARSAV
jgi:uncharacterized sulfatase